MFEYSFYQRVLDSQLTTSLHAVELLEAETEREERALQRDRALLEKLEARAKDAEHGNKQKSAMVITRTLHHLKRKINLLSDAPLAAASIAS